MLVKKVLIADEHQKQINLGHLDTDFCSHASPHVINPISERGVCITIIKGVVIRNRIKNARKKGAHLR